MNPQSLITLLWLSTISLVGAQKYDHNWLTGYSGEPVKEDSAWGITQIKFGNGIDSIFYNGCVTMPFAQGSVSMSDKNGRLLFYTNGLYVCNNGSDTINEGLELGMDPDRITDDWLGLNRVQSCITLPGTRNDHLFHIIHCNKKKQGFFPYGTFTDTLFISRLESDRDGENLRLVDLNKTILSDTLTTGGIAAAKHGNGRDWWIIAFSKYKRTYHSLLLTHNGIEHVGEFPLDHPVHDGLGQGRFSKSSDKYVRHVVFGITNDLSHELHIMDFDRCSGEFYNEKYYTWKDELAGCSGLEISPSGQFAYLTSLIHVFQVDITIDNPMESLDTVAIWDGTYAPPPNAASVFGLAQMGPDDKIYIVGCNGVNRLHRIENPDMKGKSCNLVQNAIKLNTRALASIPYYPHYRTGPLIGSICDSLSVSTSDEFEDLDIQVSPNPSDGIVRIESEERILQYQVINSEGKVIESNADFRDPISFTIKLPEISGVYMIQLTTRKGEVTRKVLRR